ncbi:hypothetical protein, partial [Thauera humireducens]|uniref:hypothetical protein n=1 Tax=Thauera humireducens TaxID=1134435 RepID=UPI00311EEFB0
AAQWKVLDLVNLPNGQGAAGRGGRALLVSVGAARQGRVGASRLWLRLFWLSAPLTLVMGLHLAPHLA